MEALLPSADHPVLDFLNTLRLHEGTPVDLLATPQDVLRWIRHFGGSPPRHIASGDLLATARDLRELVRRSLIARKSAEPVALRPLNAFLAQGSSSLVLSALPGGGLAAARRWGGDSAAQLLAPIAEAAAHLLTDDPIDLIRPCENPACILWFYDRTKAHRRRWCSMATCGNRHKVAAYRNRERSACSAS